MVRGSRPFIKLPRRVRVVADASEDVAHYVEERAKTRVGLHVLGRAPAVLATVAVAVRIPQIS